MSYSLHCLYWNNGAPLADIHKKVMSHFNIPVTYYNEDGVRHGAWMDRVMKETADEVVGFFDNDCVPTNKAIVEQAIDFSLKKNSFIGTAQVANHIVPGTHVYASPSFFFISRSCFEKLGCPTFLEGERNDVGERLSYQAEEQLVDYRTLYPTHYEQPSHDGVWKLSNYGYFGIGTTFDGGIYHLYQGRYGRYNELFSKRCSEIIRGCYSTEGMIKATAF